MMLRSRPQSFSVSLWPPPAQAFAVHAGLRYSTRKMTDMICRGVVRWLLTLSLAGGILTAAVNEVKIDTGLLKGQINGRVVAFKGIPFAAPPVGPNRWRP